MSASDKVINDIYRKIERERSLIQGAKAMSQNTDNQDVKTRCESNIVESKKNIAYLEKMLQDLQLKRRSIISPHAGPDGTNRSDGAPVVPRKDSDLPGTRGPKTRLNYTDLDLIKYDSPYLGPRIQLMLQQLEFKLSLEKKYKEGIEKLVRLYEIEGDRRNKAQAENQRIESYQKMHLLKLALKRYQDMHIDLDDDLQDNSNLNNPNIRTGLSGRLRITIISIEAVDHAATQRNKAPETSVMIKADDQAKVKTRPSRTDKWNETYDLELDKANEVEITVYDRSGDHDVPIGIMWMRIADIAEELRRKKLELELSNREWVPADQTQADRDAKPPLSAASGSSSSGSARPAGAPGKPSVGGSSHPGIESEQNVYVDSWFVLEPTGRIQIRVSFIKHNVNKRPLELGRLGRQGAIRQRKEEVHEMYGHKFVQQQFYNVMRCAFCGEFLKYSVGYQCEDCKYTCHKKCYVKVVTKCISKSSADTDPDEEKINHRIPHRFEPITNISANWCCHCGYMLPLLKKSARKCTECGLTCHADCVHLVPDFCGMSMETANTILMALRNQKPTIAKIDLSHPPPMNRPDLVSRLKPTPSIQSSSAQSYTSSAPSTQISLPQEPPSPQTSRTSSAASSAAAAAAAAAAMGRASPQPQYDPYRQAKSAQQRPYQPPSPSSYKSDYSDYQRQIAPLNVTAPTTQSVAAADQAYGPTALSPQQLLQQQQRMSYIASPGLDGKPAQRVPRKPLEPGASANKQVAVPVSQTLVSRKKIGLDDFNFLAVLGKGNFGKVMLAEAKQSKKLYAIKVLKKDYILENDEVENTRSEKRVFLIANQERHPFLLNLHSCFQTETRIYFVMEYISGGDLMWHIQKEQFSTPRAQFYAAEICLGLKYFHDCGVIYRDLKLDNILLTLDGHVKIADYGLCKENMWHGNTTGTFCGTPELMAPEILQDQKYGRAVDWWAFGVLIYQMILGQSPFRGDDEQEIFGAILRDEPLYPIHMARNSVSILQQLLTRDPWQRLGSGPNDAKDVMAHPYFSNINWNDIYHRRVQPPFIPTIDSPTDTRNFDQEFTREVPVLTPVNTVLTKADQEQFRGFSYMRADPL
ncbi:uncharacterized protein V1513DRAFT_410182 [Lipomyces chichibuensis]|uniref:uncharacterized protein n=1 Tax=Lipomyces chichibuensis TaxID=1546026 RepID=UPI0033442E2F